MRDKPYASLVGSVMYAQVFTRPDLAFALSVLGRFQSNPGIAHWNVGKKVLRYLKKTRDYVLSYHRVQNLNVVCYSDADLGGCIDDRMSTSGYIFIMVGGAVSWRSRKQTTRVVFTMESEYIGCFEAMRHGIWLRNLICDMKIVKSIEEPIKIYCDNTSAVFFAKNNRRSEASRLMDIKYLKLQDEIRNGTIDLEHIGTFNMVADPLTKALHVTAFQRHLPNVGLHTSIDNV
ncbi:secreted RxLR effector protein 161-like [Malus sylvestris]|uniref:secreted RxLR effector protein 161-like n=1 Tax=Malus sylvestris TaxID=3752 RepID=UPI0021ABF92C|nr:secreted RxLR effector protein 161-like [Malus sylvestris]